MSEPIGPTDPSRHIPQAQNNVEGPLGPNGKSPFGPVSPGDLGPTIDAPGFEAFFKQMHLTDPQKKQFLSNLIKSANNVIKRAMNHLVQTMRNLRKEDNN